MGPGDAERAAGDPDDPGGISAPPDDELAPAQAEARRGEPERLQQTVFH